MGGGSMTAALNSAGRAPLVPAEVDLSDFQYMELDVRLLRDSKFAAEVDPEAFRAGVLLWCASWHQVPAGSLPNNDVELSSLAGFGRVVKEWKKFRDEALSSFVLCSDGRLYHPTIAEKALSAWASRLRHNHGRLLERMRKDNKKRTEEKQPLLPYPSFEDWNSERLSGGIPATTHSSSGGIPPETALRGNREGDGKGDGEGDSSSVPVGTGAAGAEPARKPKATDPVEIIFGYGVPMLTAAGSSDKHARSFLGGLRKTHGDEAVIDKLRECLKAKPLQPLEWLAAALPPPSSQTAGERSEEAIRAENARTTAEAKKALFGTKTPETFDA